MDLAYQYESGTRPLICYYVFVNTSPSCDKYAAKGRGGGGTSEILCSRALPESLLGRRAARLMCSLLLRARKVSRRQTTLTHLFIRRERAWHFTCWASNEVFVARRPTILFLSQFRPLGGNRSVETSSRAQTMAIFRWVHFVCTFLCIYYAQRIHCACLHTRQILGEQRESENDRICTRFSVAAREGHCDKHFDCIASHSCGEQRRTQYNNKM